MTKPLKLFLWLWLMVAIAAAARGQSVTNWSTNVTFSFPEMVPIATNVVMSISTAAPRGAQATNGVQKLATNSVEDVSGGLFTSNLLNAVGAPIGVQQVAGAVELGLLDSVPYLANPFSIEAGALWNPSLGPHSAGWFTDGTWAMTKQSGIGIGCADLDGHFFAGSVSLQLGTTFHTGLGDLFLSVKDGPEADIQRHHHEPNSVAVGNYLFGAASDRFTLFGVEWLASIGLGNFSTEKGTVIGAGLSATFKDFGWLWPF